MAEYIDREKLLKRLDASPLLDNPNDYALFKFIKLGVLDLIEKQPAADVVEVVRCKECQSFYSAIVMDDKVFYGCSYMGRDVKPNGFCSYGKRKDGADNE
jgi:hypothetical protein